MLQTILQSADSWPSTKAISLYQVVSVFLSIINWRQSFSVLASMEDDIFESIPNKYDELNYENLEGVINQIKDEVFTKWLVNHNNMEAAEEE